MGEHDLAIEWLRKCLVASHSMESHVPKAHALLAGSLHALGHVDLATNVAQVGLTSFPDDPELNFLLGQYHFEAKKFEDARRFHQTAMRANTTVRFNSFNSGIQGIKALYNLAEVERCVGNYSQAKALYAQSIESAPFFLPALVSLYTAAMELGDFRTAISAVDRLAMSHGQSPQVLEMRRKLEAELRLPVVKFQ